MLQKFMQKPLSPFEKFSKYLLAAILVIVPLFPKFPLFKVTGSYVSIRFEDILILALGVTVLIKVLSNPGKFFKDKINFAFLIFFFVGLVSVISGAFITDTLDLKIGLLHLFRRIEYIIPFIAVLTLLSREQISQNLNFFLKLIIIVTGTAFLYGFGQKYYRFPIIITQNEEYSKGIALFWTPGSHINSTFAGHYDLASVMVLFLPIFITLLFTVRANFSKLIFLLTAGSGLWLLINSVSRISQVSYLVAVGISLLMARKFKALLVVTAVSLFLITTSSGLAERFNRIFEVTYRRLTSLKMNIENFTGVQVLAADVILPEKRTEIPRQVETPQPVFEDRSTSIRLNVEWPRALRAFSKNFLLGTGYSSIGLATDNDYLRMLGEIGLFGFLAFWLIFFRIGESIFKDLLRPIKKFKGIELGFICGVTGGLCGTFITAIFIDIFEASKFALLFWFLLGFAVYMARNMNYVQNK